MGFWSNLFVFVIGSLLIIFLVSPSTIINSGKRIGDYFKLPESAKAKLSGNVITEEVNYFELPSNVVTDGVLHCSLIEASADMQGLSDETQKKRICTNLCGNENRGYHHHLCSTDKLRCFCKI